MRCQAPARSQHAPRPWALPAAARRPRAGCPGERPPPLAPPRPLPAHGRRASPRSRASRRFADATVYPRSLAIESDDPIFRVAEARYRRAAPAQVLRPPREGERPLLRTIGPRHPERRRRRPNGRLGRFPPRLGYTLSRRSSGAITGTAAAARAAPAAPPAPPGDAGRYPAAVATLPTAGAPPPPPPSALRP
uniref:Uncharacterized protein n=1 Tax=Emiliania huxleyi (strain CCMP1516) TaxID=280463 RepID=A0A0D3IUL3_EMIH1